METTVSEMSVRELRDLISDVVEEKFAKYADPDYGLELRDEVRDLLLRQSEEYRAGAEGAGLDEVLTDLGIDRSQIEVEKDVPVTVS
ncbi:MAG: hypothetical protein KBD94_12980 [Pyrinomonadaceae bacterium]|nr:hypothetical protein [Pyrinomonadaceae bacterium]